MKDPWSEKWPVRKGTAKPVAVFSMCFYWTNLDLWSQLSFLLPWSGEEEPPRQSRFIGRLSMSSPSCSCYHISHGFCLMPRGLCSEWAPVCGWRGWWILQPGFGGVLQSCHWQMDAAANQHEHGAELCRSVHPTPPHPTIVQRGGE